jgi:hypothetical protein
MWLSMLMYAITIGGEPLWVPDGLDSAFWETMAYLVGCELLSQIHPRLGMTVKAMVYLWRVSFILTGMSITSRAGDAFGDYQMMQIVLLAWSSCLGLFFFE